MANGRRWKRGRMYRLGVNVQGNLDWAQGAEPQGVNKLTSVGLVEVGSNSDVNSTVKLVSGETAGDVKAPGVVDTVVNDTGSANGNSSVASEGIRSEESNKKSSKETVGKVKREGWQTNVPFAGVTKQKTVTNKWLSRSLMSSADVGGGEVRVRDSFGTSLVQRKKLAMMYGFRVKFSNELSSDLLQRSVGGSSLRTSLLAPVEMRLGVVRWRSGLVKSVGMAVDLILRKQVLVHSSEGNEGVVIAHPNATVLPGSVVQIDPIAWETIVDEMLAYWSHAGNDRCIPPHLVVSMKAGSVAMLWVPRDGDLLMPEEMSFSLSSLYKG